VTYAIGTKDGSAKGVKAITQMEKMAEDSIDDE
jgi:hypothetical protein